MKPLYVDEINRNSQKLFTSPGVTYELPGGIGKDGPKKTLGAKDRYDDIKLK